MLIGVALHLFYALDCDCETDGHDASHCGLSCKRENKTKSVVIVIYNTWGGFRHEWQWCWGPLHEYFYRILQHLGMMSALIAVVLEPYESEFL